VTDDGVLLFIDAIEDEDAWILLGDHRHRMPRALLPPGAREGMWLRLQRDAAQTQKMTEEIEARRQRLVGSDPGGKVKL
jgi:hypothetical protein